MLTIAVNLVETLLLLFIPGGLILSLPGPRDRRIYATPGEYLFYALLVSFCLSSLLGLTLAYLNCFSVTGLALCNAVTCLFLLLAGHSRLRCSWRNLVPQRLRDWALPGIVLLAAVLFSRPVPYVFGGWDPGVYVNTAVNLSRTGSLTVNDPVLSSLSPSERLEFSQLHSQGYPEKYPGFRFFPDGEGKLIPQFYYLYSFWLAVFHSWGGLPLLFLLTPLLGLASLLAVYFAVCRIWDRPTALLALLPLSLNLVEVWQARFPTAEMLSQFLFFGGCGLAAGYFHRGGRRCALVAGLVMGCFFVSHISALLLLPPLAVFFYCRWFRRFRTRDLWLVIPLLVGLLFSFLPHLLYGARYARLVAGQVTGLVPVGVSALVLGLVGLILRTRPLPLRKRVFRACTGPRARLVLALLVAGLLLFGLFVRPWLGEENPERTNLIELSWFLTPVGFGLAAAAAVLLILRERRSARWFFLSALGTFAGVFLWQQLIHYNYIWAARRFAVVIIPGGLILAAVFLRRLQAGRWGRGLAAVFFSVLVVQTALASRPVWLHREYEGALGFTAWLDGELSDAAPVMVGGDFVDKLPTLLHLILDRNVLPLYRSGSRAVSRGAEVLARCCPSAGCFYYLTDSPLSPEVELDAALTRVIPFHSRLLERCWDHIPSRIDQEARDANFEVLVYRVIIARPRTGQEVRDD